MNGNQEKTIPNTVQNVTALIGIKQENKQQNKK